MENEDKIERMAKELDPDGTFLDKCEEVVKKRFLQDKPLSEKRKELMRQNFSNTPQLSVEGYLVAIKECNKQDAEAVKNFTGDLSRVGEVNEQGDVDSHMIYIGEVIELIKKHFGSFDGK